MPLVQTVPINAVVAYIMSEKEGTYGPYQSVLFESPDLQGGKLWRALPPSDAQQLYKSQKVELTPTKTGQGKDSWNIRPIDSQPTQQPGPTQQPVYPVQVAVARPIQPVQQPVPVEQEHPSSQEQLSAERKLQIAAHVDEMGDVYVHCLDVAKQKVPTGTDSETIRCMASSLFISAQRRFGLTIIQP